MPTSVKPSTISRKASCEQSSSNPSYPPSALSHSPPKQTRQARLNPTTGSMQPHPYHPTPRRPSQGEGHPRVGAGVERMRSGGPCGRPSQGSSEQEGDGVTPYHQTTHEVNIVPLDNR